MSLLNLLILIEYMFIKMCAVLCASVKVLFLHVTLCDTR